MAERTYHDPCGVARALGVAGERWALLVVRELLFGGKRFTDLSRGLPRMSQNVLAQRRLPLDSDVVIRADSRTLRALVFGGRRLTDTVREGDAEVGGSRTVARAFVRCFPRPEPFG